MKHILFCIVIGGLAIGCIAYAQSSKDTNRPRRDVNAPATIPAYPDTNFNFSGNADLTNAYQPYANSTKPANKSFERPKRYASQVKLYAVCGNPKAPCKQARQFEDSSELPMEIPGELEWFGRYKSKPFYAVMVQSRKVVVESHPNDEKYQGCGGHFTEDEVSSVQRIFPNNRVFSSAFGCYYGQHEYTGVDYNYNFMAIYGATRAEANSILMKIKTTKLYPGANIRRMQAILCNGCH